MSQLTNVMKQTKRFGPKVLKMAKPYASKVSGSAKDYASKAAESTKHAASKASHFASGYGHKAMETAKSTLPDKKKQSKASMSMPDAKPKKTSFMPKVSLTKAFLMIAGSAVAALLFAPKPGKELRSDLKTRAGDMKEKGMDEAKGMASNAKDKLVEMKDEKMSSTPSPSEAMEKGEPVSPNYVTRPADEVTGTKENMVTDEYAADSAYDPAEQLVVPVDEELETSSLTPEDPLLSDQESKELYDAMGEPKTTPPETSTDSLDI